MSRSIKEGDYVAVKDRYVPYNPTNVGVALSLHVYEGGERCKVRVKWCEDDIAMMPTHWLRVVEIEELI